MIVLLFDEHATTFLSFLILRGSMKADVQAKLDELNAAVAEDTTVDGSAGTALDGLTALLAAAVKGATTDPDVLAALDAAIAKIKTNNATLGAKIVANTPAAS